MQDYREMGGADPLDAQLKLDLAAPRLTLGRLDILLRSRPALGLSPAAAPALIFLPLGVLLGPHAMNILSETVLAHLDAAVSVALATIGVFVGLALRLPRRSDQRLFWAAGIEASTTVLVVFGATLYLLSVWRMPLDMRAAGVALAMGIAAAASSAGAAELSDGHIHKTATRIADLDDVLPISVGGLLLAWLSVDSMTVATGLWGFSVLVGVAGSFAGWLLFERADGDAERGVFVVGTILFLGGAAAYLAVSPLLVGMAAGLFWANVSGKADQIVQRDLRKIQHPLVVLLLLTAGASVTFSLSAVWFVVPFVAFRLAGKLLGGWFAARLTDGMPAADLAAYLVPPGVIGIAFALNVLQVDSSATAVALVSAVAIGSVTSELFALVVLPGEEP